MRNKCRQQQRVAVAVTVDVDCGFSADVPKKKATRANPKILKRAAHTISEIKTIVREAFTVAVAVGVTVAVGVRVPSRNMALSGKALNQMSLALGLSGLRSCAS